MSRISTGTGDDGTTGLADGSRVPKTDPRVEACGTLDELNDVLGLAASLGDDALRAIVHPIQAEIFTLGADLATPTGEGLRLDAKAVARLEAETDRLETALPKLQHFILPGGTPAAAALHLARSVCRRAERRTWALREAEDVREEALVYLNRLSDLLFLLAREANAAAGTEEPQWLGRQGQGGD